jgi:hypothetical protein
MVLGLALIMLFIAACGPSKLTPVPDQPSPTPVQPAGTTQPEVVNPACTAQPRPTIIEHREPTLTEDVRIIRTDPTEGTPCIRTEGLVSPLCVQARVKEGGVSRIITSQEELGEWFGPIESAEEALSYALVATGYEAKYAPEDYRLSVGETCDPGPDKYRYYTDVLEDTHVAEVVNGYHINLFYGENVGCGPFPVSSVTVEVAFDGAISEFPKVKLYEQGIPCPGEKIVQCCID